jgi:Holliday junction resolvase RusA-like endonuclease
MMDKSRMGDSLSGSKGSSTALSVKWKIPLLPTSMNKLYAINYQKRTVYMTPEARNFKTQCKLFITPYHVSGNDKLSMEIDIHSDWFFKNGNLKKSDLQNMIKILIDAVSERLGFDDSQVWTMTANKIQSTTKCVHITLSKQEATNDTARSST